MTVALATSVRARPRVDLVRARWWMHPEAPWVALALGAWAALAAAHFVGHGDLDDSAWSFSPPWWTIMIVAMMVPGALPMQRLVVFDSLWRRRHRGGATFLAGYVSVWIAFGLGLAAVVAVGEAATGATFNPGRGTTTLVLVLAIVWQLTAAKERSVRRCHLRRAFGPMGWKGSRDLLHYGATNGCACVGSCGVMMAAMFVSAHDFHLMVPLAAVTVVERFQRTPRLVAGAAAIAVVAALTLTDLA